ncbi:MAG: hypothetical protein ACRC1M_02005 [Methanobacteriaceae archaeon]
MFGRKSEEEKLAENEEYFFTIIERGWRTKVFLPEFIVENKDIFSKGVSTLAFGLVGLAMTSVSTAKQRKLDTIVRIAEKGLVIENADPDGRDLRVPWENIIRAREEYNDNDRILGVFVFLDEGNSILIKNPKSIKNFKSPEFTSKVADVINDRACALADEGW